jgi:hypothetical protein
METRNIQTFLMISAAFFAMNMPVRTTEVATPQRLAAAVSYTARMASAGLGGGEFDAATPAEDDKSFAPRP